MTLYQKDSMRANIVDCLSQQLSEYELLKSMYPDQGDIVLSDKNVVDEINNFIDYNIDYIPNHLDYKVNILIDSLKLEFFINLPHSYPKDGPDIYVRCNQFNRQNESRLNSELSDYIKENHIGEVCLYTAIAWVQENIGKFATATQQLASAEASNVKGSQQNEENEFARLWIYSHHIYNKRKRDEIVSRARELQLTGFLLSGKPGIVCIEGQFSDCKEWWQEIKSMNWQKIMIKKSETFHPSEEKSYKKFSKFEEIQSSKSDFAKFMNDLGFIHIFNELFGLCNDE